MPRWAAISAGVVLLVLITSQFLVPGLAEDDVADRLTEQGGTAEVEIGSFPALRLLWDDGERFEVEASDLELDLDEDADLFDRLDGFGKVEIAITDFQAGPFELDEMLLARDGDEPYALRTSGTTTAGALAEYGAAALGLPGGPLAGIAAQFLGGGATRIPVELDMDLVSDDGTITSEGEARVAGLPAGPIAEVIAASILSRL